MDVSIYKTVSYVDNDPSSGSYNPIDTEGATIGDYCLDVSQKNWYIFNGTEWILSYINALNPTCAQMIDSSDTVSKNIILSKLSAQLIFSATDMTLIPSLSASYLHDRNSIHRNKFMFEN